MGLLIIVIIIVILGWVLYKWIAPGQSIKGTAGGKAEFMPGEKMNGNINLSINDNVDYDFLFDAIGKTTTVLKPSGKALIDGHIYVVEADNQFIDENEKIRVIGINGNRIKVIKL